MQSDNNKPELSNKTILASNYQVPNSAAPSSSFKLSAAHVALGFIAIISALIILFVTLSRSVEVRAIEQSLTSPETYLPLNANVTFASIIKLPLGNRVLLLRGEHEVSIELDGYQAIKRTIIIGDDANQSFEIEMLRLPGSLNIVVNSSTGEPLKSTANVSLDGLLVGDAPNTFKDVSAGLRTILIDAPLYRAQTKQVLVRGKNETQTIDFKLEPAWAEYQINSTPEAAKVFIDGQAQGQTPLTIKIEEGQHLLSIQAEKFKHYERSFVVVAGQDVVVPNVELIPSDGKLVLTSKPTGAAVILNEKYRGSTPMSLTLKPDQPQNIKLYKAGYQLYSNQLSVSAASTTDKLVELKNDLIPVKISVSPSTADVFINGQAQGKGSKTVSLNTLPQRISVRKKGYVTQNVELIPTRNSEQIVSVNLLTKEQNYWAQVPDNYRTRFGHEMRLFKNLGTVNMGSSRRENGRRSNETVYQATLSKPFYVSITEVTNKQYRAFKPSHNSGNYKTKSLNAQKAPVSNVSWQDAARYCNWLSKQEGLDPFYQTTKGFISGHNKDANGYRLLTEVEWSWLARKKDDSELLYPWGTGDSPSRKTGNYADKQASNILSFILEDYDDGYTGPSPVGRFEPNHSGLYDLDGNVSEWIHDWYSSKGNSELKEKNALVDPMGPSIGEFHVVRGGSWAKGYLPQLRLAYRDYAAKGKHDIGFRVARYAGLNEDEK